MRQRHPHDKHMEKAWRNSRRVYKLFLEDEKVKQKVLKYIEDFKDIPQFDRWKDILEGKHLSHCEQLLNTESFFYLPEDEQNFWQVVQSHPFAVILAKEQYEGLKKKRRAYAHIR